ncbi:sensor histidine kinase KdpD [Clostridium sp. 001]|nr:HAMP domain-containing sensor histidine kinase [Clostridium sp. 001]QXE17619.1 two-component sensor histidine kinase [Clostridium sp. 001]
MEVKKTSFQMYIIKFILKVGFSFIILLLALLFVFSYIYNNKMLLPSKYSEQLVEKVTPSIKSAKEVTSELIPKNLKYTILDKQTLDVKKSTMNKSQIKKAKLRIKNHQFTGADFFGNAYAIIERPKEYCVIHYKLIMQFANPTLRNLMPYPGLAIALLFTIILLITLYFLSLQFSNKIKRELNKFSFITQKIEDKDLDFEVQNSYFVEHQKVMDSLDSLRRSLKKSLTCQFEQEKNKGEQISALAHDIKIPITVIKGNAELLSLTQKDENALDYTNEIMEAAGEIEHYTELLIETSKNDQSIALHKEKSNVNKFLHVIEKDTLSSIGNHHIHFVLDISIPKELMWNIDFSSMKRAFMNIIINALEHTPDETSLSLQVHLKNNLASFVFTDSGNGFSPEALKKAAELFYTDNKSRSQTGHYGIGLTFADKVIRAHNGTLHIQNDTYTGGGQIVISLPVEL